MSKQIFLVYSCNEWKNTPMPLLLATTSKRRLKMFISSLIEREEASYSFNNCNDPTPKKMAEAFRKDFGELTRDELNARLEYVYFDYAIDGEEI